jgi:hypothetical protein
MYRLTACVLLSALTAPALAQPLTTAFTYQGKLLSSGQPATGLHDFEFSLFDDTAAGAQIGPTLCSDNLPVTDGHFTVQLDFGAVFSGQSRYLQIRVRPDTGLPCANLTALTTLAPRQPLTAAPAASFALSAPASGLTGLLPDERLTANIPRLNADNQFFGTNQFNGFTGVNRNFALSSAEVFGLQNSPAQTGYVGMYISSTAAQSGLPFYGYAVNGQYAWTMLDSGGTWHLMNNGLALSVTNTLNVGVGNPSPERRLDVAGTARANEFEYTQPVTSYLAVSPTAFQGHDYTPVYSVTSGNVRGPTSANIHMFAPINLPHGATITGAQLMLQNQQAGNFVRFRVLYTPWFGGEFTATNICDITTFDAGVQTLSASNLNFTVDNTAGTLSVYVRGGLSLAPVYGARIEYTLPRPAR